MDHKVQNEYDIITNILSGNLNSGINLAINFDLEKCIIKSNIPKLYCEDGERVFTKKVKYISKINFHGVFKGYWSFLMSCSLKITKYMHQPAS